MAADGNSNSYFDLAREIVGNPQVSNTAARHVAKAMTRVHPNQRAELLLEVIKHAQAGLQVIEGRA